MTVGIGVLASDKSKPDHVILIADTQGSFEGEYSMDRLYKIFKFPEISLYATCCNRVDRAAELMPIIVANLKAQSASSHGDCQRIICQAAFDYKLQRFMLDVLPRYPLQPADWQKQWLQLADQKLKQEVIDAWQQFDIGCDLIIGAFDGATDQAFLYALYGSGQFGNFSFPGFTAIGSGENNAMFWLSYRNHHLGKSIERSAYEAYEAKIMAERSAFVNDDIHLLVANKREHFELHKQVGKNEVQGCPISLTNLTEQFKKYGPQDTGALDPNKRHY